MTVETRKILDARIKVTATCVRVPVFIGHAEAVNIQFAREVSAQEARELLRNAPGVSVIDHRANEGYVTPEESTGEDAVYVSRIREDATIENGLNIWVVSDNLRKGAALNTVQIAELLVSRPLEKGHRSGVTDPVLLGGRRTAHSRKWPGIAQRFSSAGRRCCAGQPRNLGAGWKCWP